MKFVNEFKSCMILDNFFNDIDILGIIAESIVLFFLARSSIGLSYKNRKFKQIGERRYGLLRRIKKSVNL